jgi:serine/threonine protein kinase
MTAPRAGSDTDRARRVQQLFERALDLPPEDRAQLLAEACADDAALRAEVEDLLASLGHVRTQDFLPPLFAPDAAEPSRDLVGVRVFNYEVVRHLARGGMGAVYLARHTVFNRQAALKVLHAALADEEEMVRRFLNEARAANAIRHPNIIEVFDAGRLEGTGAPYILMEYLPGESLGARIERQGRLPVGQAVAIARDIASALAAAHAQGIVHRDLKPENVFLVAAGPADGAAGPPGPERVKVLDFGIAKLRKDIAGTLVRTKVGAGYGTPTYMAPEQCRDFSAVDQRTDVYALGVILYEMVCGQRPFDSASFVEVILQQMSQAPEPPRQRGVDLPPALESAILKALAKDPAERYASMKAMEAVLGAVNLRGVADERRAASLWSVAELAAAAQPVPDHSVRPQRSARKLYPVLAAVAAAVLTAIAGIALLR